MLSDVFLKIKKVTWNTLYYKWFNIVNLLVGIGQGIGIGIEIETINLLEYIFILYYHIKQIYSIFQYNDNDNHNFNS